MSLSAWYNLPSEVSVDIFHRLDCKTQGALCATNKSFLHMCDSDWRERCMMPYEVGNGYIHYAAWSPDGRLIATVSDSIVVWDAHSGERMVSHDLQNMHSNTKTASWSPDGKYIACTYDSKAVVLTIETGDVKIKEMNINDERGIQIYWSADGDYICGDDGEDACVFALWGSAKYKTSMQFFRFHPTDNKFVMKVVQYPTAPTGDGVIYGGMGYTKHISDPPSDITVKSLVGPKVPGMDRRFERVIVAQWTPDGSLFMVVCEHVIVFWDMSARDMLRLTPSYTFDCTEGIVSASLNATGTHVAFHTNYNEIVFLEFGVKKTAFKLRAFNSVRMYWNPDRSRPFLMVHITEQYTGVLYMCMMGAIMKIDDIGDSVKHAAWKPDGRAILAVDGQGNLTVHYAQTYFDNLLDAATV